MSGGNGTAIAVTGVSAFTPIGNGIEAFSRGLREGRDGVGLISQFTTTQHRVRRAAEVQWIGPDRSPYSRATDLAIEVTRQAIANAGLDIGSHNPGRVGVLLASNQGGMYTTGATYRRLSHPYRQTEIAETDRPRVLDGAPTATLDLIMITIGATGPSLNISTACSAGLHAIGMAAGMLRRRELDVVIVTAVEVLTEPALAGFGVLRALTTGAGPRPFDRHRDGTLLGEGVAALVMERTSSADYRSAKVWAEIAGYGSSTDAFHATRPDPAGSARAMREALGTIPPAEVDWIKAHGTGTPANDLAEAEAIHAVFGERAARIPVTSMKATLGHSLGASGVVEAAGTILSMNDRIVPPTLNVREVDPACNLNIVLSTAQAQRGRCVMANAFGFGGNNAVIVFRNNDN
jgi:3-oxoacyl-[acyl-carrier-protein] synthase II